MYLSLKLRDRLAIVYFAAENPHFCMIFSGCFLEGEAPAIVRSSGVIIQSSDKRYPTVRYRPT
ncbi:hypothetical protein NEOLEDRAFT_1143284 [Neolentinus lepideus HHB14362 ss-1]|uniref:Uncharacterized protein n=1 Tax=Neolentinus lepideus HHB14362 ss-1 TaxID=1314782 RepID=A0A165MN15_9AGAM|nr:hypothetical protein NEOLEDRAFT_1143284 [Neolentinus lepideus HHB14362 ss-1]